jgi:hypothetical protein
MSKVTREELYEALKFAALDIQDSVVDKEEGCPDCPVDDCPNKEYGTGFCNTTIMNKYIRAGQDAVKHKKKTLK